jgi:hypothetical protein
VDRNQDRLASGKVDLSGDFLSHFSMPRRMTEMPLHLEPLEIQDKLQDYSSVLLVSCPVCPPVSLATDRNEPFMEFFKHGIKTAAFEDYLEDIRKRLASDGIRTGTFTSYLPCAATCLWTSGQRHRLLRRARGYDAALVFGCESARYTVEDTLRDTDCDVILAMELVGVTNAHLRFEFPLTIRLDNQARVQANERLARAAMRHAG